jgi:Ca-activated chloride channel family protein
MRSRLAAFVLAIAFFGRVDEPSRAAVRQTSRDGRATFTSESRLVVLHVAVRDRHGYVSGLEESAFRIFEDKQPRPVGFFSNQDAPVTVGLLLDSSGSMSGGRDRVIAAGVAFAENSNPQDEIFVMGFNERVLNAMPPELPFTQDVPTLRSILERAIRSRGQTAVYDAVDAGLNYVNKGMYERKVLILVSDGGDNASAISRERVLANAQASNVVIYTVGVIDPLEREANPGFLRQLSSASGGQSFEPEKISEVGPALGKVAHDIRSMYTLGYVPASTSIKEGLRRVSVTVRLPDGHNANVRTRSAYLGGSSERESEHDAIAH